MASDLQLLPLTGQLLYTFDFSAEVPDLVTVSSIDYALPSQLTSFADVDALSDKKGTIGLKSALSATSPATRLAVHGQVYQVTATATLSNSEKVVKYLTVRVTGS